MMRRMLTALVALVGLFVALYLALYKAGVIGTLTCGADGSGGCETVQLSRWAVQLGMPVANWGVLYYAAVFVIAFAATTDRWGTVPAVSLGLLVLTGWGVLFSAWLTYLELFVIHAICRYCVVSAAIALVLFVLAVFDWRAQRAAVPRMKV